MDSNDRNKCPVCQRSFKNLLMHVSLSKVCKSKFPIDQLTELQASSKQRRSEYKKRHNEQHHVKNRPKRLEQMKQNYEENKTERKKAAKQSYTGQRRSKRLEQMKQNYEENKPKRKKAAKQNHEQNRPKRLKVMHEKYVKDQTKLSKDFEMKKQLFFDDIKYGPIFPCVCCNRDMFKIGVRVVTEEFVEDLKRNNLDSCIRLLPELMIENTHYLCSNCYNTLKTKKRMPKLCFLNGLGRSDVPDCLKLTDLENHLISKNLIFIKIRPCSKRSRYEKMHDRIVNVPIPDDDIIKSVTSLPRRADMSGLINVQLKRQLHYKNAHIEEMVRPNLLPDAVSYLKKNHPSYHDVNTQPFEILDSQNEVNSESSEKQSSSSSDDSSSSDKSLSSDESEDEFDKNCKYNDVTCLVPDEPQTRMFINTSQNVVNKKTSFKSKITHAIAPGEGKCLSNWMRDENFDIDAFPMHHGDGKYGLNFPREIKLHPHSFFSQRIMDHDKRWSKDSSYLFVGQQYVERHALERQINISMRKGSLNKLDKDKIIPLEKSLNILKKIPGTPSYWRVFKNDILAKVEQRGHFHLFFSLSCAEKKWPEVFTALLQTEGKKITFVKLPWDGEESSILVDDKPLSEFRGRVNMTEKLKKNILLVTQMFDNRVKAFIKHILKKSDIELYAYRLEWQMRGMPHIHGVAWFLKWLIEKYVDESGALICNKALLELIDQWVSVSLTNDDEKLNQLVKDVNCHKHTQSCRKYDGNCRYKFPRLPSDRTMFASPDSLANYSDEDKKEEIKKAKKILSKVKDKLENITEAEEKMPLKDFLESLEIDEKDYYDALAISERGVSIILKRTLKERNVNNYNPEFMLAWQANMDIQFCTDTYAVVTYITDYFTKPDAGFEKTLESVLKENMNCDDRERFKNIKRIYFTHRQICGSEAVYRLLPTLNLKGSNLVTKFVTSGFPENRSVLFLPKTNTENSDDDQDDENDNADESTYTVSGRKESYTQKKTVHEHYSERPEDLNNLCLAKFATLYETKRRPKTVRFENQISVDLQINAYNEDIPLWILLNDDTCMKARKSPAVLRIHSSKKKKDYEEQYAELLLFYPWRKESDLDARSAEKVVQKFNDHLEIILQNRKDCLPYSAMVAQMKEHLEKPVDMRPTHLFDILDSTLEQENEDDLENQEPLDETPILTEEDNIQHQSREDGYKFKIPEFGDNESMKKLALSLSKEQRLVFSEMIDFVKKVASSKKFITSDFSPPRIIAHGGAGVGKSFVISVIAKYVEKILRSPGDSPNNPKVILLAPTGMAASIISGTTIHTGLDLKFGRQYLPLKDEVREKIRLQFEDLQLVIIDELSMVSSDMLYFIHKRLCEIFVSEDYFGGKAVLLVGDLMQLRPVKAKFIFEKPKDEKHRSFHDVDSLWKSFKPIILETNFRQGEGNEWSQILNRARVGELNENDFRILEERRIDPSKDKTLYYEAFHVFWTNEETENFNLKKLNELSSPLEVVTAKLIAPGKYQPKVTKFGTVDNTQFRKHLKFKVGAKVMLTLNIDIGDSLINGAIGKVVGTVKSEGSIIAILVQFDNEEVGLAQRNANRHLLSEENPKATPIFKSTLGYFPRNRYGNSHGIRNKITQFALRLSWASTCHKIQGITIPKGQNLVAHGHENMPAAMQYVMMGRVSNLENLYLSKNFDLNKIRCIKSAFKQKLRLDKIFSKQLTKNYDLTFLNIRSLRANHENLLQEPLVEHSKMLCLAETWIYRNEEDANYTQLPQKNAIFSSHGRGKGCSLFYNQEEMLENTKVYTEEKFQMVGGLYNSEIQVYSIYISKEANLDNIINVFKEWMTPGPIIVIGDFNYDASDANSLSRFLHSQGLIQIVNRPTHIEGGIIDHCYVKADWKNAIGVDYIFPYYTDHAAICISLP